MKIKSDVLFKSFVISLLVFAIIASVVISVSYVNTVAVDPDQRESNLLVGLTDNGKLLSIELLHCDPKEDCISFLSIPDNTMLESGNVLQSQYKFGDMQNLIFSVEDITGARVNRYIFISLDSLEHLVNDVGRFEYLIRYPFVYNGMEYSGNTYMTGELAKAMFLYDSYDMTTASMAAIGESFLYNFLSSHSNANDMYALKNSLKSLVISTYSNTNITEDELSKYCNFFLKFSGLDKHMIEIQGERMASSSSLYFIPAQYKATKNIFK